MQLVVEMGIAHLWVVDYLFDGMQLIVEVRQAYGGTGQQVLTLDGVKLIIEMGQAEFWVLQEVYGIAVSAREVGESS